MSQNILGIAKSVHMGESSIYPEPLLAQERIKEPLLPSRKDSSCNERCSPRIIVAFVVSIVLSFLLGGAFALMVFGADTNVLFSQEVQRAVSFRGGRHVFFLHLHNAGGTSITSMAAAQGEIPLRPASFNFNYKVFSRERHGATVPCDDKILNMAMQNATWTAVERPFEASDVCTSDDGFFYVTVVRNPVERSLSTLKSHGIDYRGLQTAFSRYKGHTLVGHPPTLGGRKRAKELKSEIVGRLGFMDEWNLLNYFDNFQTRSLLGYDAFANIPIGGLNATHFEKALKVLRSFDLVLVTEELSLSAALLESVLDWVNVTSTVENYHHYRRNSTEVEEQRSFLRSLNVWDMMLWQKAGDLMQHQKETHRLPAPSPIMGTSGKHLQKIGDNEQRADQKAEITAAFSRVDCIRVIVMRDQPDRLAAFMREADYLGIRERVEVQYESPDSDGGTAGCFRAHVRAWRAAKAANCSRVLVFEADAIVPEAIRKRNGGALVVHQAKQMASFLDNEPDTSWDLLYLGSSVYGGQHETEYDGIVRSTFVSTGHARMTNRRFLHRLVWLEWEGTKLDRTLERFRPRSFSLEPVIFIQYIHPSAATPRVNKLTAGHRMWKYDSREECANRNGPHFTTQYRYDIPPTEWKEQCEDAVQERWDNLVIIAGEDTTGARFVSAVLRDLGYSVGHGRKLYNVGATDDDSIITSRDAVWPPCHLGVHKHRCLDARDIRWNKTFRTLMDLHRESLDTFDFRNALGWVDAVATDTPIAHVLPWILRAFPHAKIILTERNATEWARSRFLHHPHAPPAFLSLLSDRSESDIIRREVSPTNHDVSADAVLFSIGQAVTKLQAEASAAQLLTVNAFDTADEVIRENIRHFLQSWDSQKVFEAKEEDRDSVFLIRLEDRSDRDADAELSDIGNLRESIKAKLGQSTDSAIKSPVKVNLTSCNHATNWCEEPANCSSCASLWPKRLPTNRARVVAVMMFKDLAPLDLRRWLDYHLVLGVEHFILIDNNEKKSVAALNTDRELAPYVANKLVTHDTQFRDTPFSDDFTCTCKSSGDSSIDGPELWNCASLSKQGTVKDRMIACSLSSPVARQAVEHDALILKLDDDEYVIVENTALRLIDIAAEMRHSKICSIFVPWRQFGSSGHQCQPKGGVLSNFELRAPLPSEGSARQLWQLYTEACALNLNHPDMGKTIFFATTPGCIGSNAHECLGSCGDPTYINCGQDPSKRIAEKNLVCANGRMPNSFSFGLSTCPWLEGPLSLSNLYINHYAYQSAQHFQSKQARGRTNQHAPARANGGGLPGGYNAIKDTKGRIAYEKRLRNISNAKLKSCLLQADEW